MKKSILKRKGLSEKEIEIISYLELNKKYFFEIKDIQKFFNGDNERKVYTYRLKKKGRIVKLNRTKFFLIPIRATKRNWSEHPFIIIDEIMNGKDYCIVGKAAANYWGIIDQIPSFYIVWNTKKHKKVEIFNSIIFFKKNKKKYFPKSEVREIYNHKFMIASKKESKKWK